MKKTFVVIFCLLLICVILVGCTSKEAKAVIDRINALGEITLDSFEELQSVYSQYDALSDKDKESVTNIDVLNDANKKYSQLKCDDLITRIDRACAEVTSQKLSKYYDLQKEYFKLSGDEQEAITNYQRLVDSISDAKKLLASETTSQILFLANGTTSMAESMLHKNSAILSESQITNCLSEIGRWRAIDEVEEVVKTHLKSPRSYNKAGAKCTRPEYLGNNKYKVTVYLDYDADNSFGASLRDSVTADVSYQIHPDSLSVEFESVELSAYDKWRFATGHRSVW